MSSHHFPINAFARLKLAPDEVTLIEHIFDVSRIFFESSVEYKKSFLFSNNLEGWRNLGSEFSETPDRPDLNEAFSLFEINRSQTTEMGWIQRNPLHAAMSRALDILKPRVNSFLEGIRFALAPQGDPLYVSEWSYLQANYYRPMLETRELLQDPHEDGHLLTVILADQPGLEFEIEGAFLPAPRDNTEAIVMPGSVLTKMTGGRIAPLTHRVRRQADLESRTSLMYFINPSLVASPRAWFADDEGRHADIREAAIASSIAFGLPRLDLATSVKEDTL